MNESSGATTNVVEKRCVATGPKIKDRILSKMMMQFLAFYERATTFVQGYWEKTKTHLREWLGPEPQKWYLLEDGRVLPSTVMLPTVVMDMTYCFDPSTNRITLRTWLGPEGRFRPMPYLALTFEEEDVGITDISDWLGELRTNPAPVAIPVEQLITLWSFVHNQYVPMTHITIRYTKADGSEDTVHL